VIIQAWVSHFVIAPPLIVTREELDKGIAVLDKYLSIADEQCAAGSKAEAVGAGR
jgi:taurine--2-oxoglutarate transaminase